MPLNAEGLSINAQSFINNVIIISSHITEFSHEIYNTVYIIF